jgi:acetyl esterase/lipase
MESVMNFADYARRISSIGREVSLDTVMATRAVVQPLVSPLDTSLVNVTRDVHYSRDARCRMDVFTPAAGFDPARPALVFVHGGGFIAGDKHAEGSPFFSNIGQWAVQHGCNGVTITYRLAPAHQWPSGVEDLQHLIQFIQQQGAQYGLAANNIFLMGQSAGAAHVASYVAHPDLYAPQAHGLKGLILLSGMYNYSSMPISNKEQAYLGEDASLYAARSSLHGLLNCGLPVLVTVAENDPPMFEQQYLELLEAWQKQHRKLPVCVYAAGQNHMSVAMALGLDCDLIGPRLQQFIVEHSSQ